MLYSVKYLITQSVLAFYDKLFCCLLSRFPFSFPCEICVLFFFSVKSVSLLLNLLE